MRTAERPEEGDSLVFTGWKLIMALFIAIFIVPFYIAWVIIRGWFKRK